MDSVEVHTVLAALSLFQSRNLTERLTRSFHSLQISNGTFALEHWQSSLAYLQNFVHQRSTNDPSSSSAVSLAINAMSTVDKELLLNGHIGSCLDLLWRNREATSVVVDFSKDGISQDESLTLFRSLAHCPKLLSLRVCDLKTALPVKALSVIFNNPTSQLRHLTLENVKLTGKVGDYMVLVESLRLCSLQTITMDHCEFDDKNISLDPLVRGLATIATLEHVSLIGTNLAPEGKRWTPQCLLPLLAQLRSLTLKELPNFQYQQICMLASALEEPFCALREFTIQKQNLSDESIVRFAQMLQKNTSLKELTIDVDCTESVIVIAKHLHEKKHQGLLRLSFPGEWGQQKLDFYSEARQVLLNMVQTNTQLACLDLGDDENVVSMEMANYVSMNLSNLRAIRAKKWTRGQLQRGDSTVWTQ